MGRWDKLKKILPTLEEAKALLAKIATPEEATKLRGAEREAYLNALDVVYGPQSDRIPMVLGDKAKKGYHGTAYLDEPISEFRPSRQGYYGEGIYTGDRPAIANSYVPEDARAGQVYPVWTSGNLMDVRAKLSNDSAKIPKEFMRPDMTEQEILDAGTKSGTFDGVTAPYKGYNAITNPAKIRSQFAAFDPRFKDSKNILAGGAGAAILGGAALAPEESEAAGLETIMKKLGVGLEEAKKIKDLAASKAANDVFEQNLRALSDVTGFKRDPSAFQKIGRGADYVAYESPKSGKVLKVSKDNPGADYDLEQLASPALMDSIGAGVNTKVIDVPQRPLPYLVQDKVTPLTDIQDRASGSDKILRQLFDQQAEEERQLFSKLKRGENGEYSAFVPSERYKDLEKQIIDRKAQIFKESGIDPADLQRRYENLSPAQKAVLSEYSTIQSAADIPGEMDEAFRQLLIHESTDKLKPVIKPYDLHEGNIGLNSQGAPVAFDTSRFQDFNPKALTPEQRKAIEDAYIASPKDRSNLSSVLNKKTAGLAGAAALGAAATGGADAEAAPLDKARLLAEEYAKLKKLAPLVHSAPEAKVNVDRARKIAEAYEALKHNPNDPAVRKAYDALVQETVDQFELLKDAGLKTEKITPNMQNPYKSSEQMIADVRDNNHLWYFPTEQGFGSQGAALEHPLLKEVRIGNETMPANDAFRVVHDYFGHAKEGSKFGPKGEENAWREHMKMFSPEAQKALTTETRGQNSWVNYGPHSEANRVNPENTIYADQKAGLLPEFAYETSFAGRQKPKAMTPNDLSPLPALEKGYRWYNKHIQEPLDEVSAELAEKILRGTTPLPPGAEQEQFVGEMKPILGTGVSMAADPLNFVPGLGFTGKGAKAAEGATKIMKAPSALETAASKLKKAAEAGETVGVQTGVDKRSFQKLKELLKAKGTQ